MRIVFQILFLCVIACRVAAMSPAGDTAVFQQTYCSNQIVIINNHIYGPFKTDGLEVIPGAAANGMDSIFKVMLTFLEPVESTYTVTLCEGDSIKINNTVYHQGLYQGEEIIENGASNGCDSIINIQLSFIPPPFSYLIDTLCSDASITVNGNVYDMENRSGLEILSNASVNGCDSLVYISLFFREQWVYLGPDTVVVDGDSICIALQAQYPVERVDWTPLPPCTDPDCLTFCTPPLYRPAKYAVQYTDSYGCISNDEVTIYVDKNHRVYGPNVFDPRLDEPNNRFFVTADRGVVLIRQLWVYDRWGEPVFYTQNVPNNPDSAFNQGWDGSKKNRDMHTDVYMWWAEFETRSGEVFQRTGDVTLIR
jgi:hypothetical protein